MSNLSVKFFDKEYSIPSDVVTYVGLVDFTNGIKDNLIASFKKQIWPSIDVIESDNFMISAINDQVTKFVRKLLENDIYDRTANDYLQGNKGYELFLDTKRNVLRQIISIRQEKLDTYRAGVEGAIYRKEASVTGLDFGIISSSFVNHMIYAYMDASKQTQQEKEALKTYNREIAELDKQVAEYDRQENAFIADHVIPAMSTVFTFFAYELLDKYVSDLIKAGKFDKAALDFINLERSNDLLENINLAKNKRAVIESAFVACPFNMAVYLQAMKYDFLDYDSFQTAKVFKQDHHILSFFRESWGEVSFPTKFNINYHCINVWASLTGKSSADLLRGLTEQYATGIVKAYSRVADIMADQSTCRKIIAELKEDAIISGVSICVGKAREYVDSIVNTSTWEQLTEKCGHTDLLSRIKKYFLFAEELQSKKDFDSFVAEQLVAEFEDARKELAEQIEARRAEEERQRLEREKQNAKQARIQAEKKAKRTAAVKKGAKRTLIAIGAIVAVCIALIIAGIIFLFATDKPIDDDFSQSYEDSLHGLTYCVPENWKYSADESGDNESCYTRHDNWGNFLGAMVVSYEGETPDVTVDSVIAEFKNECSEAKSVTENIDGQDFTVITFELESADATPFFYNIYVSEEDYSVFYISFIFVEESNKPNVFNEIVGAIAFDDYVNPKEKPYNEAISLMSTEKYNEAISIFTELGGYKDSAAKITECKNAITESNYSEASRLMGAGDYEKALAIFQELDGYKDSAVLTQECTDAILENKYNNALQLMSNGNLEAAIAAFETLIGYKDSGTKISECKNQINENKYNDAVALASNQAYDEAIAIFDSLGNYKDATELSQKYTLLICGVGDTITFGTYEQDNNLGNGAEAIEWIVLERAGNKVLVVTEYCIEWLPFNNTFTKVSWKNSSIRSWLNNTFLNGAFTAQEKKSIISTQHTNPDFYDDSESERNWLGTTTDTVFLLSSGEADEYFSSDSARKAEGTKYASNKGKSASWYWWLRSANNIEYASFVSEGELGYGEEVNRNMGIRPAMWIKISE